MVERVPRSIAVVAGTRPEALKLAPVVLALRSRPDHFRVTIVSTGQHRDMLAHAWASFGLVADIDLDVMQPDQTLAGLTAAVLGKCTAAFADIRPCLVMVQGDTTSAFAAALAGFYAGLPVAHVEAGLRTGDPTNPFPEEVNRRLVAGIAALHFAPTQRAARMLRREGVPAGAIHVTGNTIVDALELLRGTAPAPSATIAGLIGAGTGRLVLVTCHRRESFGADLDAIVTGVGQLAARFPDIRVVLPMHPNPNVRRQVLPVLSGVANVSLIEPLPYPDMLALLGAADLVITDSGGLQEEAPSFGAPVLVLRRVTERPEGVRAGFARLVPPDAAAIVGAATHWLRTNRRARLRGRPNPYGDGQAAERIAAILEDWTP